MSEGGTTIDIASKHWLAELVDRHLQGYDPAAARLRLPREVREEDPDGPSPEARARILVMRSLRGRVVEPAAGEDSARQVAAFLAPIEGHLALLLDLALLQGGPFEAGRRRAELAAFFAAAAGDLPLALAAEPDPDTGYVSDTAVRRALSRVGPGLVRRGFPPGDPAGGIRIYAGAVAVERRVLARIARSYYRQGHLDAAGAEGHLAFAAHELTLLAMVLVGLAAADGPIDARRRQILERQVARLGLARPLERRVRAAVDEPPSAAGLAREASAKMHSFLLEQMLLATLGGNMTPSGSAYLISFAEAAGVGPEDLAAMQVEAAAFHADHLQWFRAFATGEAEGWEALANGWNAFGEQMVQRVARIVLDNLDAIATEIRQTGELGQLLGKAATGTPLDAEERRKVKAQLIDLAKAVPALAIFAAPGGMLLLPLLAKLLPFNILPSAFQQPPGKKRPPGSPAAG